MIYLLPFTSLIITCLQRFDFWDTEITYLKKVGPERAKVLAEEAGIRTYGDLLHYFPRKYVDKSQVTPIRNIHSGLSHVTVIGKITEFKLVKGKRMSRLTATFTDGTGSIELVWFKGIRWIRESLKPGQEYVLFGQPSVFNQKVSLVHPEMETKKPDADTVNTLHIVPYYPSGDKLTKKGLDSKGIRQLVYNLLQIGAKDLRENLPQQVVKTHGLMGHAEAIRNIHFPENNERLREARRRMKFEELFFFQLMLAQRKAVQQPKRKSHPFPNVGHYFNAFYEKYLPFELTGAQKRVLKEIRRDLAQSVQMNRLVQGDVGCGKTMVAFMTMLIALDNGYQAAIMAPTEILAEQHYSKMKAYADPLGIKVGFLVGGQKKSERGQILQELQEGHIQIVVGTHALIEDSVQFKRLGLAIVDEQHKFGVMQRAKLWHKGELFPHNMLMTATPIPRTLGMTLYGDVDISVIDELPPGRTPVKTAVRAESQRLQVFGFIREQLKAGRQAYIVYPLVEESQKVDYLAVTEGYESISRAFQGVQIGIVHGKMPADAKDYEMQRFKRGETKILVATTVIEVGVDVPNATIMVIENSEKFGLSQLHQLRGRVGRGGGQSYCILMVGKKTSEDAKKRLRAMVSTHDGFKIAEYDLKLRGPGDFLGTKQSGLPEFKIADLTEDMDLVVLARESAFAVMKRDPDLESEEHREMKFYFTSYHKRHKALAGIA